MGVELEATRELAKAFSLADSESDTFKEGWDFKKQVKDIENKKEERQAAVDTGFQRFAGAVNTGVTANALGHDILCVKPVAGKYVVFSDHHLTHGGNRQNYMSSSGNMSMYVDILSRYADAGFTVVENGDVEDLVVLEPSKSEFTRMAGLAKENTSASWAEIATRRRTRRIAHLQDIIHDAANADYYRVLADLQKRGQLVRCVGNHDYELQRPEFLNVMRTAVPDLAAPCDYLFLSDDPSRAGGVRFAILHGHQFDTVCVPSFAPKLGEVYSEALAWAYQGADRVWRWTGTGAPCQPWVEDAKNFNNTLVVDEVKSAWDATLAAAAVGLGGLVVGLPVAGIAGAIITLSQFKSFWEALMMHNIAWEYFEHSDPSAAVTKEVATGDSFFKYRHLDEVWLKERLETTFPNTATRPKVLLGHTHEARYKPAYLGSKNSNIEFDYYLNSGAAGRFENLIWAIEIVDGVERVVSWSRPTKRSGVGDAKLGGPAPAQPRFEGTPERREYSRVSLSTNGSALRAGNPIPLPVVPQQAPPPVWLPAVLQMMMR